MRPASPHCYANHRSRMESNARVRAEKRAFVAAVKMGAGCARCGFHGHPDALDLHHVDPAKECAVSVVPVKLGWTRLRAEVAKCEVICANCHATLHAEEREG